MSEIKINEKTYRLHQNYSLYGADENGNIINIVKQKPMKGVQMQNGYLGCSVRKYNQKGFKFMLVHRFVWEYFNGPIQKDKVVDHINDIKNDNRLCNIQMITPKENCQKSAKNRDCSNMFKTIKCIKATNLNTNNVSYFNSTCRCSKLLGVNAGIIYHICNAVPYYKSGKSKMDGCSYKFEYIEKSDIPYSIEWAKIGRPKLMLSCEDKKDRHKQAVYKWQKKPYTCSKCNKIMQNCNKQYHNKKCK